MRLTTLDVADFGCVRQARLELGPGLNVLFGPNDLGKSSLADAVRAALLLPPTSVEHREFVPWGAEEKSPEVTLAFQLGGPGPADGKSWSVTKTFGPRGTAILRSARDGQPFQEEERKKVDARLRELLAWGVPAPGGKGAPRGAPGSFLTAVLLARQADVAAVLGTSLTDDPDESGRRRLTDALQQLAQDPRFRTVLERTQERVAEAFTSTGQRRRGADSPFRKLQATIEAAEKTLADLDAQARQGEDVRARIRALVEARDQAAAAHDQARATLAALEAAARARAAREEAERRVAEARARVEQVEGELAALAEADRRRTALAADAARAAEALAAADAAQGAAEAAHAAAAAAAQRLEAEQAQARVVRLQALDQQLTEARHRLEAAERAVKESQATGELVAAAAARERELAEVQGRAGQQDLALRREAAALRLDEVHLELRAAQAAHALLAQAETERARRQAALGEAIRAWEEAAQAERAESAAVEAADEKVRAARSKAKAQDRAVRLAELDARRAEVTGALEAAERDLAAAERAATLAERAARADAERDAAAATAARCQAELAGREATLAAARAAVDEAEAVGRWLGLRAAREALEAAEAVAARVEDARRRAAALLAQAQALEPAQPVVEPGRVRALRALEADLRAAEARIAVGLRVVVRPRRPLGLELQRDGGPSERLAAGTAEQVLDAKAELRLALGDVADLVIQGGGPQDQARAADLRARWAAELAAAGAGSVDELDARVAAATAARAQADGLRQQARLLEEQARAQDGAPDARAAARARVDELTRELAGHELEALARRAAGVRSPADARRPAEAAVRDAQAQVERANVALAAARATAEARSAAAAAAQADAAAARVPASSADPRARRDAARGELTSIAAARASAEAEGSVALHQAEAERRDAEARRFDAAARRAKLQTARDAAQRALAEVDGLLGPRREAARAAELEPLQRRAVAARLELQAVVDASPLRGPGQPPRARAEATTEAELEGRRRAHEADRAALGTLQGQLEAARARRDEAVARAAAATASAGAASWDQVRRDADAAARAARLEVGRLTAERERAAQPDAAPRGPGADREAAQRLATARAARSQAAEARDRVHKALGVAEGEVATRQARAAALDLAAARRALADQQAALAALPAPALDASPARLASAAAAAAAADVAARKVEGELAREEGALALVGGAVAQDRAAEAREALERARDEERELDLDCQAWLLLQRALEQAERTQATHLGHTLVPTVSARLAELTARRYGGVAISPELVTEGVVAAGGARPLERLSVGTREQLATILRLTLAEQLGSFLLLDDQLAQSDTGRLGWFQAALRRHAERHQVVVFTCRPEDYLDPEQLRAARSGTTALGDRLRAVDLERVIKR